MFNNDQGKTLLHLARASIGQELGFRSHDLPRNAWLEEPGATFVTLMLDGQLRGCIGTLEACRPLIDDVCLNAISSAFRDPRFPPLTKEEFAEVLIEVSLLSKPELIRHSSEQDALTQLNPGRDGVIFECDRYRATYLPQIWAQLPDPRSFIANLKSKAGLPPDFWSDEVRLSHYTVQKWREGEQP
ncbi:MAG: AMMECR1 domain-containing protein [Gallionellales bacterium GWA2_59_43]|nr:MAG: AMMECR1 domain-containing protein [Gallionellales bacterium GWA2_59_43]